MEGDDIEKTTFEAIRTKELFEIKGISFKSSEEDELLVTIARGRVPKKLKQKDLTKKQKSVKASPNLKGRSLSTRISREEKIAFWNELVGVVEEVRAPIMIAWDFNEVVRKEERKECSLLSQSSARCGFMAWGWLILSWLVESILDMGGRACSRLDRVLVDVE
ncbi:hypothetical protein PIB30_081254 [Stylosanthes scabra]|uniref:Uncharacterized protein n=1 Tax=Stylosanthes scabra TaxID=79078 RepID=A0ABU6SRV9_9FABA|nr:hypothetical protein [Stylosanthes scabra]